MEIKDFTTLNEEEKKLQLSYIKRELSKTNINFVLCLVQGISHRLEHNFKTENGTTPLIGALEIAKFQCLGYGKKVE